MPRIRHKRRRKPPDIAAGFLLIGLVLAGLMVSLRWGAVITWFDRLMPVRHARIEGGFAHVDPEDLRQAVLPLLRRNYLTLDLAAVERAAAGVPWVKAVRVVRIWPDAVVVDLVEHLPLARWGGDRLISAEGVVFPIKPGAADFSRLPVIDGPAGHEREVLAMLQSLNGKFVLWAIPVMELRLSDRLAWTARLSNGLEIAYGNKDPLSATDRMMALLPRVREQHPGALQKLDLRYPSGFAVTWRPELVGPVLEN